jgi:hypothetical protein
VWVLGISPELLARLVPSYCHLGKNLAERASPSPRKCPVEVENEEIVTRSRTSIELSLPAAGRLQLLACQAERKTSVGSA